MQEPNLSDLAIMNRNLTARWRARSGRSSSGIAGERDPQRESSGPKEEYVSKGAAVSRAV